MAPNPVSLHGYIVLVGFLPMYLAGGFGIEFPMIGFPELDTTYASTGFVKSMMFMMAGIMGGAALSEIRGEMSLKTFVQYHWLLSPGLLMWQMSDSATALGKMMFVMPHMFTAWSTAVLMGDTKSKSK